MLDRSLNTLRAVLADRKGVIITACFTDLENVSKAVLELTDAA